MKKLRLLTTTALFLITPLLAPQTMAQQTLTGNYYVIGGGGGGDVYTNYGGAYVPGIISGGKGSLDYQGGGAGGWI